MGAKVLRRPNFFTYLWAAQDAYVVSLSFSGPMRPLSHRFFMKIDVILGLQWGDEGKGKIVDYLAERYDVVARFQGGPNAGHTLHLDGQKYVLHTVPSGIFRPHITNLIGNGVVLDPIVLRRELEHLDRSGVDYRNRLLLARKAHLILPTHRWLDMASEAHKGQAKIGSTLKGIGPTYMDKTGRNGLRLGDVEQPDFRERYETLKNKHLELLRLYPPVAFDLEGAEAEWFASLNALRALPFVDGEYYLNDALNDGKRVLAEGAQGAMLDIDFGTYPFVTSSNTVTAGVCTGLGVAPHRIGQVIGISKAYCTRVGSGPFPTELTNELGDQLRQAGGEFGATTGRPRRCGWLDVPQLRYTIQLTGATELCLTKLDVLGLMPEIAVATHYRYNGQQTDRLPYDLCQTTIEPMLKKYTSWQSDLRGVNAFNQLPSAAQAYVEDMEALVGIPIRMVSVGPGREQLLTR